MPRRKPHVIVNSIIFRVVRIIRAMGFQRAVLRVLLQMSWVFWRLAYEISSTIFGAAFETATRGITADLLQSTIPPGGTVLDLGCGAGRLSRMAAPFSATVVGVDMSADNIQRAHTQGVPPNVEYRCADGREVLANHHYDVVMMVHVLEHIDEPDALLRMMREHTAAIIVEVPNFESDALNSMRLTLGLPYYSDADHVREYTPAILQSQLERSGFKIVEQQVRGASIVAVATAA